MRQWERKGTEEEVDVVLFDFIYNMLTNTLLSNIISTVKYTDELMD